MPIFAKVIIVVRRSYKSEAVQLAQRVQQDVRRKSSFLVDPSSQLLSIGSPKGARPSSSTGSGNNRMEVQVDFSSRDQNHNQSKLALISTNDRVSDGIKAASNVHCSSLMHLEVPSGAISTVGVHRQSSAVSSDARKSMSARGGGGENGSARKPAGTKSAATTVALLSVSFYYVFTTLSLSVVEYVQMYVRPGPADTPVADVPRDRTWRLYLACAAVRTLVVDFAMSHYAIFFYIYLLTSPAFRRVAVRHLAALCPPLFGKLNENILRDQRRRTAENFFS